jgi:hypothetical protein
LCERRVGREPNDTEKRQLRKARHHAQYPRS